MEFCSLPYALCAARKQGRCTTPQWIRPPIHAAVLQGLADLHVQLALDGWEDSSPRICPLQAVRYASCQFQRYKINELTPLTSRLTYFPAKSDGAYRRPYDGVVLATIVDLLFSRVVGVGFCAQSNTLAIHRRTIALVSNGSIHATLSMNQRIQTTKFLNSLRKTRGG